jgi:hypothetical protein
VPQIKYMIIFEDTIYDWLYQFYPTVEAAEAQMKKLSATEGKVVKVTILDL